MSHRLRKHADVAAELVRITRDDLAAALAEFDVDASLAERVHSVRLRLKWVRSTLRVLQRALGEEAVVARRQAAAAARLLAGARDADVAAASARVLSATIPGGAEAGFDRLADALDQEALLAHRQRVPLADVRQALRSIAESASRFATDFDGEALLDAAIARAYQRGRRAMRQADEGRGTADLHRWRKEAKHLWHLLRMARDLVPRSGKMTGRIDQLVELLGLDHDHAVLAERLALAPHDRPLARQLQLIAERRRDMEAESFALGAEIYADRPRDFAVRVAVRRGDAG